MKPQKQGRGRPKLPDSERRSEQFIIRVNAAEKAAIEAAHENASTWAREILLKAAAKQSKI
jgi:hypothetical protein